MSQITYVSANRLSYFLDKLKDIFAPASHNHDKDYYTKSQVDDMELITVADIDAICGDLSLDVNMTLTNFSVTDDGQGNVVVTR